MVTIEAPHISAQDPIRQLQQMKSYLVKTSQQLQWAFDTLEAGTGAGASAAPGSGTGPAAQPPKAVFSGIKNLIIKSADIVDAYAQEITKRLEGVYTARSEFGEFTERTAQSFQADSQKFSQLFENHQILSRQVEGLSDQLYDAQAYVKSGLLGTDREDRPVYGLEVGQRNRVNGREVFDRFARFTANRLSFFDSADVEVAYISDYKLFITHAEVSGSLILGGRFKVYCGGGLIFQWTGGNEHG